MWRSLWRSIDRFSLHYFKYVINELRDIQVVDMHNREVVVDLLQSIVEIVTYGQSHNPSIFECFMEFQVLAEFVRLLNIAGNSRIEAPLLQYLSIMIQNMDNKHAIYYCLSNGYINHIITHPFKFDGGDLVPYYISFLRAVSAKIDKDTICLLVKVNQDAVVSLPLYAEALEFAHYGEKMIQIAVRAITLNVYNVADDMVHQYLTTPPVSEYFSSLFMILRKKCFQVDDALVNGPKETWQERKRELISQTDGIVDDLYYLKDIICIGDHRLSSLVTHNMVDLLFLPVLLPPLHVRQSNGTCLSAITSLYVLSRLFQVFDRSSFYSLPLEITQNKWGELLDYIFSSNYCLMLASLMLLLVVAETKDVDHQLAVMIDQIKIIPIVDALLKGLASEPPCSVLILHTAWLLRKVLVFLDMKLEDHELELFKTSYDLAYERLCKEFSGCWCDYIPDTLRNEWPKCKAALDESSQSKDPFFVLDLAWNQISANNSSGSAFDWQQMVEAVKVFIIHIQLKAFILGDDHVDIPLEKLKMSSLRSLGKRYASDLSSASFGSEVALGHGIPCRIAFSAAETRDIYVIPVAKEVSGKLFLVEQHSLHSRKGVVIAIAPLAGSNPKIDENHPTWLHLQLREFEPSFDVGKPGTLGSTTTTPAAKGRWTLGFSSADYCSVAYSAVLEESRKQRLFIESLVHRVLPKNSFGKFIK